MIWFLLASVASREEVSLCGITPERLKAYEDGEEPPPSAPSYHGPIERERPIGEIGGVMEVDGSGIPIIRDQVCSLSMLRYSHR